jgi:hypothetical protein
VALKQSATSSGYGSGSYQPAPKLRGKAAAKKLGIDREKDASHKPELHRSSFAKKLVGKPSYFTCTRSLHTSSIARR